jgi:hypothetical protein
MNEQEIRSLLLKHDATEQKEAEFNQSRAWIRLRDRLYRQPETDSSHSFNWITGGGLVGAAFAACALWLMPANVGAQSPRAFARAEQSGLDASSFYAPAAQADVVWISGLSSSQDDANIP